MFYPGLVVYRNECTHHWQRYFLFLLLSNPDRFLSSGANSHRFLHSRVFRYSYSNLYPSICDIIFLSNHPPPWEDYQWPLFSVSVIFISWNIAKRSHNYIKFGKKCKIFKSPIFRWSYKNSFQLNLMTLITISNSILYRKPSFSFLSRCKA